MLKRNLSQVSSCVKTSLNIGFLSEFIVLMMLPLSVFAPQSTTLSLYGLAAVFSYDLSQKCFLKKIFFPLKFSVGAVFLLPLLGFVSCCWSLDPVQSLSGSLRLLCLSVSGFIIVKGVPLTDDQPRIIRGLVLGFIFTLVLLSCEILTNGILASAVRGYPIRMFKYNKSICLVALMLPLVLQLLPILSTMISFKIFQKNFFKYLMVIVTGLVTFHLESDACKVSYAVGVFLFIIFSVSSLNMIKVTLYFLISGCFIGPFIFTNIYYNSISFQDIAHGIVQKPSVYDRLSIWHYTENIILKGTPSHPTSPLHLLGGFGMNTSKIGLFRSKDRLWSIPNFHITQSHPEKFIHYQSEGIPLHPHNFILQVFLELGFLGLAFVGAILCLTIKKVMQPSFSPMSQKLIGITFATSLIISSISFGFWQSWWISTLWLVVFATQLLRQQPISLFSRKE